jgi:hypothetical protein
MSNEKGTTATSEPLQQPGSRDSDVTAHVPRDEKAHLLQDSIAPLDSYTEDGIYWADLPYGERVCTSH